MRIIRVLLCMALVAVSATPTQARAAGAERVAPYAYTDVGERCEGQGVATCELSKSADAGTGSVRASATVRSQQVATSGGATAYAMMGQPYALKRATPGLRITATVHISRAAVSFVGAAFPRAFVAVWVTHGACRDCDAYLYTAVIDNPAAPGVEVTDRTVTASVDLRNPAGPLPKGTVYVRAGVYNDAWLAGATEARSTTSGTVKRILVEHIAS